MHSFVQCIPTLIYILSLGNVIRSVRWFLLHRVLNVAVTSSILQSLADSGNVVSLFTEVLQKGNLERVVQFLNVLQYYARPMV